MNKHTVVFVFCLLGTCFAEWFVVPTWKYDCGSSADDNLQLIEYTLIDGTCFTTENGQAQAKHVCNGTTAQRWYYGINNDNCSGVPLSIENIDNCTAWCAQDVPDEVPSGSTT